MTLLRFINYLRGEREGRGGIMLRNTAAEQRSHGWRVVSPGERPQPSVAIVTLERSFLELMADSREGSRWRTSASQPSLRPVCTSPPSPTGGGLSSPLRLPLRRRSPLPICLSALRLPSWGGTPSLPPPSRHLPLSCAVIDMDAEGEAEGEGEDLSVKSGGGK